MKDSNLEQLIKTLIDAVTTDSEVGDDESYEAMVGAMDALTEYTPPNPAAALIAWLCDPMLDIDEPMTLMRLWNEGEFDTIREEWGEDLKIPDAIFIGADIQFVPKEG